MTKTKKNQTTQEKLIDFAKRNCLRPDWHEPDEQSVSAKVIGRKLDNAMGDDPYYPIWGSNLNQSTPLEKVVVLTGPSGTISVNLATLLALATGYKERE